MQGDEQHVPTERRRKTLYFDSSEIEFLETVRGLLMELDRVKYGEKKVKKFEGQSRYSYSNVLRNFISEMGREYIKRLEERIEEEKKKKIRGAVKKKIEEKSYKDPLSILILTVDPARDDYLWDRMEVY